MFLGNVCRGWAFWHNEGDGGGLACIRERHAQVHGPLLCGEGIRSFVNSLLLMWDLLPLSGEKLEVSGMGNRSRSCRRLKGCRSQIDDAVSLRVF
jgi:hypothetical protein